MFMARQSDSQRANINFCQLRDVFCILTPVQYYRHTHDNFHTPLSASSLHRKDRA